LGWTMTLPMKYLISALAWGMFFVCGTNTAFCAFGACKMIDSCVWSIHPFFQSMFSYTVANHGYPKIALCSPRLDRKKHSLLATVPIRVSKSV
jgi:hypothetical protein